MLLSLFASNQTFRSALAEAFSPSTAQSRPLPPVLHARECPCIRSLDEWSVRGSCSDCTASAFRRHYDAQHTTLKKQIADFQKRLSESSHLANEQCAQKDEEVQELKTKLKEAASQNARLVQQLQELTQASKERDDLKKEVVRLTREIEKKDKRVGSLEQEKAAALSAKTNQKQKGDARLAELEAKVKELEKQITMGQEERAKRDTALRQAWEKSTQLEEKLKASEKERFWQASFSVFQKNIRRGDLDYAIRYLNHFYSTSELYDERKAMALWQFLETHILFVPYTKEKVEQLLAIIHPRNSNNFLRIFEARLLALIVDKQNIDRLVEHLDELVIDKENALQKLMFPFWKVICLKPERAKNIIQSLGEYHLFTQDIELNLWLWFFQYTLAKRELNKDVLSSLKAEAKHKWPALFPPLLEDEKYFEERGKIGLVLSEGSILFNQGISMPVEWPVEIIRETFFNISEDEEMKMLFQNITKNIKTLLRQQLSNAVFVQTHMRQK